MDMINRDLLLYEDSDSFFMLDNLHHKEVTPLVIANILFKFCDLKSPFIEDNLVKLANLAVEKLIHESPLKEILCCLDSAEFQKKLLNKYQFEYSRFFHFCRILCSSDKQGYDIVCLAFFASPWKANPLFQLDFIRYCILSNNVAKILSNCHTNSMQLSKPVPLLDQLKCQPDFDSDIELNSWKFQALYQILMELSESQVLSLSIEELFASPIKKCPDLVILGLLDTHVNTRLKDIIFIKAMLKFLYPTSHPNSSIIFQRILPQNNDFNHASVQSLTWSQRMLLMSMIELYSFSSPDDQQQKLSRILDLSQDLKALNLLLSSTSHSFVIDLACLASRREYLKLDKWLNDKIQSMGAPFIENCIAFLRRRCSLFGPVETNAVSFPNETFGIILTCLRQFISDNPKTMTEMEIMKMYRQYSTFLAQSQMMGSPMMNPTKPNQLDATLLGISNQPFNDSQQLNTIKTKVMEPNASNSQPIFPDIEQEFSKEIEEEADSYFQKIFNQDQPDSMSVDQVLEMLKKFQESPNKREKEVFSCMIRNLFKEYPFLSHYPDKELIITGKIFGGIILYDFVKGYAFVGALRYVLESLRKPVNSRYFTFGQAALDKLKPRLKEFPQFCQHIYNIPHFCDFPTNLVEYVEYGKQSQEPPSAMTLNFNSVLTKKVLPNMPQCLNKPMSLEPPQVIPSEIPPNAFQDKIAFIVNNLSQINLSKKAEEFKELVTKEKEQYYQWLANYFIMKRVSLEANFHELYAAFLLKLLMPELTKLVLAETYRNIKIILRSNKDVDNFSDRSLLKNLGQWLGLITLAQNKPILSIELDLRNLLIESYHKGLNQLQYVVPFVSKVLFGVSKSRVFRPPCPWTDALISILVELHSEEDLKLNLKFEVEVLCKHLEIDITFYHGKSSILKNKEIFAKIEPQLGMSITSPIGNVVMPDQNHMALSTQSSPFEMNNLHHNAAAPAAAAASVMAMANLNSNVHNYTEINVSNIANLSQAIIIQSNLQMLNPALPNMIKSVIEGCVKDWISYVSERVVKVCLVATETLIKKDFANEPNAELMRNSAHKMMRCLIAGYSLISTLEPLANRMQSSLQNLLTSKCGNISKGMIDSTVEAIVAENIELCVCFVQKTCVEKGIDELDKKLKPEIELRQNDNAHFASKVSPLSLSQILVYEEMGRNIPGFSIPISLNNSNAPVHAPLDGFKASPAAPSNLVANVPNYSLLQNEVPPPVMDTFVIIYDKLIKHLSELIQEFEYAHYNTEAMHQVLDILRLAKQNPRDQATALNLIKNVINGLRDLMNAEVGITEFAVISRVRDFYLLLLKALTDQRAFNVRFTTTNITRCVMEYWISINQSFPDDLFDILWRASLINFIYMDSEFYQLLENGQNTIAINIILNFLKCYLANGINSNFFSTTLELLNRIAMKVNQSNHPLLTDLKNILSLARLNQPQNVNPEVIEQSAFNEKVDTIIKQWISFYNSNKSFTTSFHHVVKDMNTQGLLKNDELIARFFRVFLEFCVDRCYHVFSLASQHSIMLNDIHTKCYEFIDAFSMLVLLFIKQSGSPSNVDLKFQFLNKILIILATTAVKDQEYHSNDFKSLPYYRILITIFIEFFYSPFNLGIQEFMLHGVFFEQCKVHLVRNYCNLLHFISPQKIPSFAYAWLDVISHRIFIGKCLDNTPASNYKTWQTYYSLLNDLLSYQKPILQNIELIPTNPDLFKGTLKLFLLLSHDFPEFLCEYCYNLCDLIPFKAVQLRNIILSAFPSNVPLPEPCNANLKIDTLHEIFQPAKLMQTQSSNQLIEQLKFRNELDNYILTRNSGSLFNDLFKHFINSDKQVVYNVSLMNALTLYIGMTAIQAISNLTVNNVVASPFMDIFQSLFFAFDSQGRYLLLNSMVDHLRYPNKETLFYICTIVGFFNETDEPVREQICRVLLERLLANRPHPWGIVFTVNELIRNPTSKLLDRTFIKSIPTFENFLTNFFQGAINNSAVGYLSNCNDVLLVDSR